MSRWAPIPVSIASSLAMADLSPAARCAWLALRIAHATHGQGGVLPKAVATARGLPLAVPALLADLDVGAALVELARAGLTRPNDGDDGLVLADWDAGLEQALCTSCRRRNPDPRHGRCPACRSRDADPKRRKGQKGVADRAQTDCATANDQAGQENQGLAGDAAETAQTDHRETTDRARPRHDTTRHDKTNHQTRASAPGAPAAPAGDPNQTAPEARGDTSLRSVAENAPAAPAPEVQPAAGGGDVQAIASAWAEDLIGRGVERMIAAIHAGDVVRLLAAVGTEPPHVHDPDALARDRRDAAQAIIRWCSSPEQLARWVVLAHRRGARNVAGYLRAAAKRGDPATLLARHGDGDGVLAPDAEDALRGEHVADVDQLVAGGAAMRDADTTDEERATLRAQLADLLRRGRAEGARRVLIKLVGSSPSDITLARAVDGICTLDEARRLLEAA